MHSLPKTIFVKSHVFTDSLSKIGEITAQSVTFKLHKAALKGIFIESSGEYENNPDNSATFVSLDGHKGEFLSYEHHKMSPELK